MNTRTSGARALAALLVPLLLPLIAGALVHRVSAQNAPPVRGAAFTTVNEDVDGPGHCANGNPQVNCNIYDGKPHVWLNGGPSTAYVGPGEYFFAVLAPGGQRNPNDGGAGNLSDTDATPLAPGSLNADGTAAGSGDDRSNRTFRVDAAGNVSYDGTHDFAGNKIRLMPYDDTTNPGGVYIMAICSLDAGYPVTPSRCKYDAFKVRSGGTELPPVEPPIVTKDAAGAYEESYSWGIAKAADPLRVTKAGGSATFDYTVSVSHDAGTVENVKVSGTISIYNPNDHPITGVDVTDRLSDGTTCAVEDGIGVTLDGFRTDLGYTCDLGDTLPQGSLRNTVTITWPAQAVGSGSLAAGSDADTTEDIWFDRNAVDECVDVDDSVQGVLGEVCVGGANPTRFTYSRTVPVPPFGCLGYDNTARFTTNDTGATGSASAGVEVCGPIRTDARTIGFWQNPNGQKIIKGEASKGVCPSATWLRGYAPFTDLKATATCSEVASYVTTIIKAANSSGKSMNPMLKAQMLATALDTYFSDSSLGGNQLKAPGPLGPVVVDTTRYAGAFGGATSMTVSEALAYAASQSNGGGSTWYGQVKSVQELAKDLFDDTNNERVFAP